EHGIVAAITPDKSVVSLAAHVSIHDSTWIADSECTRHITYHSKWFKTKKLMGGLNTVGGKNKIPISAVGQAELNVVNSKGDRKILLLGDVLYAPQLKFSLLSVPAVVKQNFRFTFKRGVCIVNTNQRRSIKAKITEHADLYQFDAEPTSRHQAHVALTGKTKALALLHKPMGHANMRTLQDIPRNNSVLNFDSNAASCSIDILLNESCIFAKSHRAPFYAGKKAARADYPFQKIHSDICVPFSVLSIS
ncbi:TPA: hypothetical protein N0F65_009084, partial [Lagenidium giganteum]